MALLRINETTVALTIMAAAVVLGWGRGVDTSALALLCSDPSAFGPPARAPLGPDPADTAPALIYLPE